MDKILRGSCLSPTRTGHGGPRCGPLALANPTESSPCTARAAKQVAVELHVQPLELRAATCGEYCRRLARICLRVEIDGHIESLTKVRKQKQELKLSDQADHIGSQLSSLHQRVGSGWVSTPPRLPRLIAIIRIRLHEPAPNCRLSRSRGSRRKFV